VVRALSPLFDRESLERSELRARPVGPGRPDFKYTAQSLGRALRTGIDAAGKELNALMPRYEIDDAGVGLLDRHLELLAAKKSPGVTPDELRFATVVTPEADRASAAAMLRVLQTFIATKNAGSRQETRRRTAGGEGMYLGYRTWVLDVWELHGPPDTWAAQLDDLYRERPVFALVSGIGGAHWEPVHSFCERVEVPCVLPNAGAAHADRDFYSIYFTGGAAFDGAILARHLLDRGGGADVVQVHRAGGSGAQAANSLREALAPGAIVENRVEPGDPASRALRGLCERKPGFALVLWLDAGDLAEVARTSACLAGAREIYISASLAPAAERIDMGEAVRERLRVILPFDLPQARAPRLVRVNTWLKARGIPIEDGGVQANTFFAVTLFGDAMSHLIDVYSREYLIERIEHMASLVPNTSLYPRISLAPGQRYASKGGYIARFSSQGTATLVAASDWIVP
jgi:hypothetical protein